ncbi:LOW QUALITY PROTEIN: meiosis-specific protein MEI4 [Menidia menidia]
MVRAFLIRLILSEINALAQELWHASQVDGGPGLGGFPVVRYQNSCFLFWLLERLLQSWGGAVGGVGGGGGGGGGGGATGLLAHLEQRLFPLAEEFPLFSVYLWKIGGLLTSDR